MGLRRSRRGVGNDDEGEGDKRGLLIPREVAERALGEGSEEVEIFEEPGRLLISPARAPGSEGGDPILALGEDPVHDGITDGSTNHDRYLYRGG